MRVRSLAILFFVFATSGFLAASAWAQGLPPGSYQRTCRQIHWAGTTLVAECLAADGRYTGTGLPNANRCSGDIGNNNGQLQCTYAGGAQSPGSSPVPRGQPAPEPGGGAPGYGAPGYGAPGYGGPGNGAPSYGGGPGYGAPRYAAPPAPGYGPPGYSGYDEHRAHCEELWHREQRLRERLQDLPWGPERADVEHRLHDVHEDRDRLGCRD
jgi:hypothetical protein